jgi:hypothetical protein
MVREAEQCRRRNEAEFFHVWMGRPVEKGDDCLFTRTELMEAKEKNFPLREGYGLRIGAADPARYGSDSTGFIVLEQRDQYHFQEVFSCEWEHKDAVWTAGRITQLCSDHRVERCIIDEQGLGGPILDSLKHNNTKFCGFSNIPFSRENNAEYANRRTQMAYKLKDLLQKGFIALRSEKLIEELNTAIRYSFQNDTRKILQSKESLRSEGIPSPNLCDALLYCISLCDQVRDAQERPYHANRMPTYSAEEPLLKICGVF